MIALARECVRFHELLSTLIMRELRARYRGSVLGSAWLFLQPLVYLVVYYVVFSEFVQAKVAGDMLDQYPGWFALSMFCGLVPWIAFTETVARGTGCVIENGSLIKKFAFPSELLPAYLTGVSLITTVIGHFLLAVAVYILHGELPHFPAIIPLLLVLQAMFTLGLVYLLSSVTVFVRDVGHMLPMILGFWVFLSPVFFPGKLPSNAMLAAVMRWNPITYLIESWRAVYVDHPAGIAEWRARIAAGFDTSAVAILPGDPGSPPWRLIGIFAVIAVAMLFVGYRAFMRLKPRFADEV